MPGHSSLQRSRGSSTPKVLGAAFAIAVVGFGAAYGLDVLAHFICPSKITTFNTEYAEFKKGDRQEKPTIWGPCICISDSLLDTQAKKQREVTPVEPTINPEARKELTADCDADVKQE